MPDNQDTFVLRPTWGRITLFYLVMVPCAGVFLVMAAIAIVLPTVLPIDSLVARLALWLGALVLMMIAAYCLLILRTTIILIEVGPQQLKLRLPRLRGPLPLFSTTRAELPYSAIAAVETREEVYSGLGIVTVQHAYSIVMRDGTRILLGIMAENWGYQMRFDEAATRVAARAGMSVTDRGAVRVGGVIHAMLHDVPPWNSPAMTPLESQAWHRRAAFTVQLIMLLVAATAILRACGKS